MDATGHFASILAVFFETFFLKVCPSEVCPPFYACHLIHRCTSMTDMERGLSSFFDLCAQKARFIRRCGATSDPVVTGLEYDSRRVQPGNLYCALPGIHTDGHKFIGDALKRGAVVVVHQEPIAAPDPSVVYLQVQDSRYALSPLAAAFYGFPSRKMRVIGVTGTEGKSTTVYLIHQLLCAAGKKSGFISTVRQGDGVHERENPEHQTTPEAPIVHRLLAQMLNNGCQYAVVEASSHGLSQRTNRLGDIAFTAAVCTNVRHEHLEFHGTWEQYRSDKANLFRSLDPACGFGVMNSTDPSADYFACATAAPVYRYSSRKDPEADLAITALESTGDGNTYTVYLRETGKSITLTDQLPGAFNADNVLAALLTVSHLTNHSVASLAPLVAHLVPVKGRMTAVTQGQNFEVIVDYAHTPSSFETIFPPLRARLDKTGGRIISVFGSAGERDTQKRPLQGQIASHYSDILVLTDEDPRGEPPLAILEDIAAGCPERIRNVDLFCIPDRPSALRKAFSLAQAGDLVLLLGKGHENSLIYADETRAYDEISEAQRALAERGQ
ncbi:MAG: UDP-N-acetylmuramoyl-L-alanyl-D-glutamate--2,6-diaminopimelate ligase [Spirochaetaceae bacterium]|nr:UDP-N-acetylmuramoyl-L-alanyl-D-glutamate--2,6-diaminopimelate ligase [Spirochaetaceae bacterium]